MYLCGSRIIILFVLWTTIVSNDVNYATEAQSTSEGRLIQMNFNTILQVPLLYSSFDAV